MSRMKVNWEWEVEHVDEHEDIVELHHTDNISELDIDDLKPMEGCVKVIVALARIEYTEEGGMQDRVYFYPNTEGQLTCEECPNMSLRKDKQKAFAKFWEKVGLENCHQWEK